MMQAGCGNDSFEFEDIGVLPAWASSDNTLLVETVDISLGVVEIVDRESAGLDSIEPPVPNSTSVVLSTDSELSREPRVLSSQSSCTLC